MAENGPEIAEQPDQVKNPIEKPIAKPVSGEKRPTMDTSVDSASVPNLMQKVSQGQLPSFGLGDSIAGFYPDLKLFGHREKSPPPSLPSQNHDADNNGQDAAAGGTHDEQQDTAPGSSARPSSAGPDIPTSMPAPENPGQVEFDRIIADVSSGALGHEDAIRLIQTLPAEYQSAARQILNDNQSTPAKGGAAHG